MRLPSIGLAAALLVGLPLGGHRLVLKLGVRDMYTQKRIVKLTHFKADVYSNYITQRSGIPAIATTTTTTTTRTRTTITTTITTTSTTT